MTATTPPEPATPAEALRRAIEMATQLRDAMIDQYHAAGHAIGVHAMGEDCSWCVQAADEADGDYACLDWKRWQASYEAAMTVPFAALLGRWADELDTAPALPTMYRRAQMGVYPLWMHSCGAVEAMTDDYRRNEVQGGCDACESGSDNPDDWRPLYLPVDPAAVEEAGPCGEPAPQHQPISPRSYALRAGPQADTGKHQVVSWTERPD
jgi:hypothetical protein